MPSSTTSRCSTIGNVATRRSPMYHRSSSNCRSRKKRPPDFKTELGNKTQCRSKSPEYLDRFTTWLLFACGKILQNWRQQLIEFWNHCGDLPRPDLLPTRDRLKTNSLENSVAT